MNYYRLVWSCASASNLHARNMTILSSRILWLLVQLSPDNTYWLDQYKRAHMIISYFLVRTIINLSWTVLVPFCISLNTLLQQTIELLCQWPNISRFLTILICTIGNCHLPFYFWRAWTLGYLQWRKLITFNSCWCSADEIWDIYLLWWIDLLCRIVIDEKLLRHLV